MREPITVDELYRIAGDIYEDDYMAEAIVLYRGAMLRKEPTEHHFILLSEAERIEKIQFLRKLIDKYSDSKIVRLEFAKRLGGKHVIKICSELLSEKDIEPIEEYKLRYSRFRAICDTSDIANIELLIEDFMFIWNKAQVKNLNTFRSILLKYLLSAHHSQFVPALERISKILELDTKAKLVIEAKIELFKRLEVFRASE